MTATNLHGQLTPPPTHVLIKVDGLGSFAILPVEQVEQLRAMGPEEAERRFRYTGCVVVDADLARYLEE